MEKFLKAQGYSSANITAIKKMPDNTVIDGSWVHMNRKLESGDLLTVNICEEGSSKKIPPMEMDLDIVYEDEDILVINKPAGLPIHPSLNHYDDSLANGLAYYYESQGKPFIFRCANRLDKDTSGLTVVSKHLISANILSTMVKNREFHREYYAIVRGYLEPKAGTIDAPIGRISDSIISRQVDFENGEKAVTHYKVINESNGHSLVSIQLETGRTHQIRVHMTSIGHPLVNDPKYGPKKGSPFAIKGQALHSLTLTLTHPVTKEEMTFTAPLPQDMEKILTGLRNKMARK